MSNINVKITDTGWLLTKGDKTISIKDNGDGRLANGDELSAELAGSGFTQQDITLVANELNNPQTKSNGKTKGNFWGNFNGFMSGLMGGMSSLFSLGGMFGMGGGFFGGQDSWAFNGCGGVGFNDMRVWNYGQNSNWSGDIGYTGSTQGAYGLFGGDMFGGMNGLFGGMNPAGMFGGVSNNGLNLGVTTSGTGNNNGNNNGDGKTGSTTGTSEAAITESTTRTETTTVTTSGTDNDGDGDNDNTDNVSDDGKGKTGGADDASNKKGGPRFFTGDSTDTDNGGRRKSITD